MSFYELPLNSKKIQAVVKQVRHYDIAFYELPRFLIARIEHPVTEPFVEAVHEAFECLSACGEQEIKNLYDSMNDGCRRFINLPLATDEDRHRFAIYYVAWRVYQSEISFKEIVEQSFEGSEIHKIYPELADKLDKDGLIHLDDNLKLYEMGIEYKDHILLYHHLFRSGYTSSFNFSFLGRFIRYYEQSKGANTFRIALDYNKLILKQYYSQTVEFDTWFGPKFDVNKLDDPNYVGLTVVSRNKELPLIANNDLERTEFYWSFRDNIKTFEIEEISRQSYTFNSFYFNRYIHSERDIASKAFRHLDGAIKVYIHDNFTQRITSKMPTELKSHHKVKLWRIDGDVDLDSWLDLISFFFKSNEMVIEYFDPEQWQAFLDERFSQR